MHYKIYASGSKTLTDQPLVDAGWDELCRDSGADWERVAPGPDGEAGTVCSWKKGNPQLDAPGGIPERFSWTRVPKTDLWVGHDDSLPPGPVELARKTQLQGTRLTLGDGRAWEIPTARAVPYSIVPDADSGDLVASVDERFRKFSERAFRHATLLAERQEQLEKLQNVYFGVRLTEDELQELYVQNRTAFAGMETLDEMDQSLAVTVLFDEAIEQAVDALSINYRLNRWLIGHFRLLRISPVENHLRDVCLAALEAEEIIEALKKNDEERRISLLAG